MRSLTYLAVLEPSSDGYGVFFPDLPGCISAGANIVEAQQNAREALELHIYGMEKDGDALPSPTPLSRIAVGSNERVVLIDVCPKE